MIKQKLLLLMLTASTLLVDAVNIFTADFEGNSGSFVYSDNVFRSTNINNARYASGIHVGGLTGTSSYLQVELGGIDNVAISNGMSGGWSRDFVLSQPSSVSIEINYRLIVGSMYEVDEFTQVLCSVDGVLIGLNNKDYIVQVAGDGDGGSDTVVGYTTIILTSRSLTAGSHRITIGGYNNKKTTITELSRILFNKIIVTTVSSPTKAPIKVPTRTPTKAPVKLPIRPPTRAPIKLPSRTPTKAPVKLPIRSPIKVPIKLPTRTPTKAPVKLPSPSKAPVKLPTRTPTKAPAKLPIRSPTKAPIKLPTRSPTKALVKLPTRTPTKAPAKLPIRSPTKAPIKLPTRSPTKAPIKLPTRTPTKAPIKLPTRLPTKAPVKLPTNIDAFSIRISTGADTDFLDSDGITWGKDQFFGNKGGVYSVCPMVISGTALSNLYCKERYFNIWQHAQPFRYDIPVPRTGAYTVKLHFAETYYKTTGSRVFDVWVGGNIAIKGLDIVAEVGYAAALVTSTVVQITNPFVSIEFIANVENPKICAIEVIEISNYVPAPNVGPPVKVPARTPSKAPIQKPTTKDNAFSLKISSGADADVLDSNGLVWEKDKFFGNNGGVYSVCPLAISGTSQSSIYCKERYFNIWQHTQPFRYEIPVPRVGAYTVKLHFAETFYKTAGSRIFDVWIGGNLAIKGLDIVAEVGYAAALVISTVVQITNPLILIEFIAKVENPKICGVEVIEIPNVPAPAKAPVPTKAPIAAPFDSVLINCGGDAFVESSGVRTWIADRYFIGGSTYSDGSNGINQTLDDGLYQSERNGEFRYEIPVPVGSYEVVFHFAELYWQGVKQRLFNVMVEDTMVFKNVDMVKLGGGSRLQAFTLETPVTVVDGFISIAFSNSNPKMDMPSLAAIEVNFLEPHLAHSVANGPYTGTDVSNNGRAEVKVDGSFSHSHATGAEIVQWTWKEGGTIIGVGSTPIIALVVGIHTVTLTVTDNFGHEATDTTTITVNPFGYPAISKIDPIFGSVAGGEKITISGSGFNHLSSNVKVFLGWVELSGTTVKILDQFTIELIAPPTTVAAPVAIKVQTPVGTSNSMSYTYQTSSPISFNSDVLTREIASPTCAAFGPDGFLYVGTLFGTLARIQLDNSYTQVISTVTSAVAPFRAILGIAFDPLQTSGLSDVFITTSFFFNGSPISSGGQGINGNVKKVSGANLDIIIDIVTGLPVSDHDHGLTGLEYGDNGEIYIQCASNTNGGIPGRLTGKQVQKDNFYSSATVVAQLADPLFNGAITYTAEDDGIPNGGHGIEVFAAGTRNPFGICLHSNGNLYASDNGPNFSYGDMMTGCQPGESKPDVTEGDKINLLVKGGYYGAPNRIRALATNDPRQCVWRSQYEPSGGGYTAPILNTPSSTDGLIEFHGNHFEKQMRGNLIAAKYQGSLLRIILTPDGKGVIPQSDPAIQLTPDVDALDVTQAPDGTLISTSLDQNALYFHKPIEAATTQLQIKSVYPRRGGQMGGNTIMIFGENFDEVSKVLVGGRECNVTLRSASKVECTLPGGTGTVDIIVSGNDGSVYNFEKGYRYITGLPL